MSKKKVHAGMKSSRSLALSAMLSHLRTPSRSERRPRARSAAKACNLIHSVSSQEEVVPFQAVMCYRHRWRRRSHHLVGAHSHFRFLS